MITRPDENGGEKINFRSIGIVRTRASDDEIRQGGQELESAIEVFQEFQDALDGIDGYSHVFVLCYLHKLRPEQIGPLKVRPRRLLRKGFRLEELPLLGVFALDSPTRPNPIGLSLVRLVTRKAGQLIVRGLDYFDGTPVLDIKPYKEDYRVNEYELPEWYRQLQQKAGGEI